MIYVLLIIIGGLIIWIWALYNGLVTMKARIKASKQEIGNQLKRQAELIPNLLESVKGYLKHETAIFDKLTEARKSVLSALESGSAQKMTEASDLLQKALSSLKVIVESNPQIQGNQVVSDLMNNLRDTADKVMYSRRLLIDLVADYNIQLNTFPNVLVIKIFGFSEEEGLVLPEGNSFNVSAEEMKTPSVKL